MIEPDNGFCPYSHDPETGGHSPEWTIGDPCRWCGAERQAREPDIEVTPDLARNPWTTHRGGSYREGDVRRAGLYRHPDRGTLVAILVHLTDGSDLIAYAGLSTVEATVRVLASSPAYREHRQSLSGVAPWTTLALVALCVLLAGVVVVVVFA